MASATHRLRPLGFLIYPKRTIHQQAILVKGIMEAYSTGMKWRRHPHPLSRIRDLRLRLHLEACDRQYIGAGQVRVGKVSEGHSYPPLIPMTPATTCTTTTALLRWGHHPVAVRSSGPGGITAQRGFTEPPRSKDSEGIREPQPGLGTTSTPTQQRNVVKEADIRQREFEVRVQESESYLRKKIEDMMLAQDEVSKGIQMVRQESQQGLRAMIEAEHNLGEENRKMMEERAMIEEDMRIRFAAEETARREAREAEARSQMEMMKRAWEQLLHDMEMDMNRVKAQQLARNVLRDEIRADLQAEATMTPNMAEGVPTQTAEAKKEASVSPIPSYSPEFPYSQSPDRFQSPSIPERRHPLEPRRRRAQEPPPEAPDPPTEEGDDEVEPNVDKGTGAENSLDSGVELASSYYSSFRSESRSSWRGERAWRAEREARRSLRIFREELVDPICDTLLSLLEAYTGDRPMEPSVYPQPPHSPGAHDFESVSSGSDPKSSLSGLRPGDDETVTPRGNRQSSRRQAREALRRPRSRKSNRANENRLRTRESSRAYSLEESASLTENGPPALVEQEPRGIEEVAHENETPDPADLPVPSNIKTVPRAEGTTWLQLMSSTLPDAVDGEEALPPACPSPEVAFGLSDEENSGPTFKTSPMSPQKTATITGPHREWGARVLLPQQYQLEIAKPEDAMVSMRTDGLFFTPNRFTSTNS
ncbi:uncharacterized protein N7482_007888 [Penicillium canariense]|uniref:Uncharacterized protein n=1 Tax=Penicillium canariense TaxID=189055 RepID=A0A9W9HYZ2_9EURO|nr:uncharacterized protein N7482_007888 [Penicillium canariense]KAJ5160884.1 hypothetical protein N7482_007888 [Penicillium canariense]